MRVKKLLKTVVHKSLRVRDKIRIRLEPSEPHLFIKMSVAESNKQSNTN